MIDHLSITVSDIEAARRFYDAVLATLGAGRAMDVDFGPVHGTGYGHGGKPSFWIGCREDAPADAGRAGHVAFTAPDRPSVDAFHRAALASGAQDDGAPGLRPHYHENYYAAFVIDPDGYRLEAVCHRPE